MVLQSSLLGNTVSIAAGQRRRHHSNSTAPLVPIPFTCGNETTPQPLKCPATGTPARRLPAGGPAPSCPDYFRYIHDDLRPWRGAGITREAVERARPHAFFRLVVVGGRAYVETYQRAYQTRDVFTQWGILQLIRRYPGRVPDLDIMFACDDPGQVRAADFPTPVAGAARVPVLQGRVDARHRVPGLVLLGLAGGGHPAVDADAGGGGEGERARAMAGEAALRLLEGGTFALPHPP